MDIKLYVIWLKSTSLLTAYNNKLLSFLEWGLPITVTPSYFIFFTALACLQLSCLFIHLFTVCFHSPMSIPNQSHLFVHCCILMA